MAVRDHVFGSKEERKYFRKLSRTWGDKLNIYHNLPFLSVFTGKDELFDSSNYDIFTLNDNEYDKLKKTSIDFVICNKDDKPLVCIDFDGIQGGFNVGTKYIVPEGKSELIRRRDIFELKLKVAHGSLFPYFIVGSELFKGLSESVYLTIMDGIIGEVLATNSRISKIDRGFSPDEYGMSDEEFGNLDEIPKRNFIEDWVIGIEVESDYTHNPIFKKVAEVSNETKSTGFRIKYLNDEPLDPNIWVWVECEVTNHQ